MKNKKIALNETPEIVPFYFGKDNYKWMLIGLGFISLGFILMIGTSANTNPNGDFDANYWNESIFSFRRIRLAPLLIILGFGIEVYSIMKTKK